MGTRATTTLAAALALLAAAGCGGGGGGSSASTANAPATLTATQLRTQAEGICARFVERYASATADGGSGGGADATTAERRRYARAIARGTEVRLATADELAALAPPSALRRDFDRFVASLRTIARSFPTEAETMAYEDPRAGPRDAARLDYSELATRLQINTGCG